MDGVFSIKPLKDMDFPVECQENSVISYSRRKKQGYLVSVGWRFIGISVNLISVQNQSSKTIFPHNIPLSNLPLMTFHLTFYYLFIKLNLMVQYDLKGIFSPFFNSYFHFN